MYEDYPVNEITVGFLREWVSGLKVSARTVRSIVNTFSQILNEAVYDEAIEYNPTRKVRLPKLDEYDPEPYSDVEAQLLLSNAKGWFRNFLGFLFLTGMRIGEVCALRWESISETHILVAKTMRNKVSTPVKTRNIHSIPIFNGLRYFIAEQHKLTQTGLVFPEAHGADYVRGKWVKLLERCGMEGRVLYNTRHTFAIKALDSSKFKVSEISKLLGHTSTQMLFQKYAKWIKSEQMKVDLNFSTLGTSLDTVSSEVPKIGVVI
jgi:integrase